MTNRVSSGCVAPIQGNAMEHQVSFSTGYTPGSQPQNSQVWSSLHEQSASSAHHNSYSQPMQVPQLQSTVPQQNCVKQASYQQPAMQENLVPGNQSANHAIYHQAPQFQPTMLQQNAPVYGSNGQVSNQNYPAHNEAHRYSNGNEMPVPGWNLGQQQPQQIVYYPQPRRYTQRDYPQLQSFTGQKPEEWPSWIAYYRSTTAQYGIPPHEFSVFSVLKNH
jgi:hypothetical protein